jgi:hypothetical protein
MKKPAPTGAGFLKRTVQRLFLHSLGLFSLYIGVSSHFAGTATCLLCGSITTFLLAAGRATSSSAFLAGFFLSSYFLAALFLVFALAAVFAFVGDSCTRHSQGGGSEEDEFLHGGVGDE